MKEIINFCPVSGVVVYDFVSDPWGGWQLRNRVYSYYNRGVVASYEAEVVIFRDPPPQIGEDTRLIHVFKRVFPNGKLVIQYTKSNLYASRVKVVDFVVHEERRKPFVEKVKGSVPRGCRGRQLRKRSLSEVRSYLKGLNVSGAYKSIGRKIRIHSTCYLTKAEWNSIIYAHPHGTELFLTACPSIYERLSRWAKNLGVTSRIISKYPRFWDMYMRRWLRARWLNDGLRPKDISYLIYRLFGYRVTARRVAVLCHEWFGVKGPPI